MDYLDYVQMTKTQRFAYKLKSFFMGIPRAIVGFFKMIGLIIKKFFVGIGRFFKNFGVRFAKGDIGTKLSYVFMGMGNIFHGQIMKGILFLAAEIGYVCFMIFFGAHYISRIYTSKQVRIDWRPFAYEMSGKSENVSLYKYGTGAVGREVAEVAEDVKKGEYVFNPDTQDNSSKILLFFILTMIVTIVFIALYIANTKSAYETQQIRAEGKKPDSFGQDVHNYFDSKFHVTLLFLPILLLVIFNILPIIFTIFMAFTNYDKNHQSPIKLYQWVGVKNFADVFYSDAKKSTTFGLILVWTLVWAFFATFTNYILGIIVALLINKKGIKFKGFWRTMFVVTAAVPQFVTLLVMKLLLDNKSGAINNALGTSYPFLTDWANVTIIIVNIWIGIPFTMLMTSGLLMNIPEDLYESARIDGANAFQQFTKITFPYIFFVTTPYLITTFVGNINNFNVIFFLTGGGPEDPTKYSAKAGKTDLLVTWLYKLTVDEKDYRLAAVIGILVFIVCAIGSLIAFNMSKASKNEEEFS